MNRDQARLNDILEYGGLIRRHTGGGRAVLDDEVTQAAVTRWIEVIGEAAGAVSAELRVDYPRCPGGTWSGCATSWSTPTGG